MKKRPKNKYAKDLRTPKYKMRVVADKKKKSGLSRLRGKKVTIVEGNFDD